MPGVHSIAFMGDINDGETEGERLERLLAGRVRAEFARDHDIRGGPSMIAQHVSGNRPISLEAAIAYCKGLGTTLDKLSPRLALLVRSAGHHLDADRPQPLPVEALLDQFGALLADIPQLQRDAAAQALAGWTASGGAAHWRAMFLAAITPVLPKEAPAAIATGKRKRAA